MPFPSRAKLGRPFWRSAASRKGGPGRGGARPAGDLGLRAGVCLKNMGIRRSRPDWAALGGHARACRRAQAQNGGLPPAPLRWVFGAPPRGPITRRSQLCAHAIPELLRGGFAKSFSTAWQRAEHAKKKPLGQLRSKKLHRAKMRPHMPSRSPMRSVPLFAALLVFPLAPWDA